MPLPQIAPVPGGFVSASSGITTLPPQFDIATTETKPYKVDITNYTVAGDVGTIKQIVLFILPSLAQVDNALWVQSSSLVGTNLTITILGSGLQLGTNYQLQITISFSPTKVLTFITNVSVVA